MSFSFNCKTWRENSCQNSSWSSKAWDLGFNEVGNKILRDKAMCRIYDQECKYTGENNYFNHHLQKHDSNLLVADSTYDKDNCKTSFNFQLPVDYRKLISGI